MAPSIVTFFQHRFHAQYTSDFISHYGKVGGPAAPREAGTFWARFFGFNGYVCYQDVSAADVRTLRNTVACVQRIFGNVPFVNKNVKHLLRIDAIAKIFQNSVFLVVERELRDAAISFLRGRKRTKKALSDWWSARPANHRQLEMLPLPDRIAGQLGSLRQRMERDLRELSDERVLRVSYESFCEAPESLIAMLQDHLQPVKVRNPPESSFRRSVNKPETAEERRLIELISTLDRAG